MSVDERLSELPIFPLPNVVLMPSAVLPLHVFEPRYRALVESVLASDRLMGIATLRPGYEAEYGGAPAIHPEIGVGRVVHEEQLADGRSNIVLSHVTSVRLEEELSVQHPFRVVRAHRISGPVVDPVGISGIRAMVLQLALAAPSGAAEIQRLSELQDADLLHTLARRMFVETDEQRAYLGSTPEEQVGRVTAGLANLLAGIGSSVEA